MKARRHALLFAGLFFLATSPALNAGAGDPPGNAHVKVEARLARTGLPPGAKSEILFTLTPVEGIHINAKPAPEFSMAAGSPASVAGSLRVTGDTRGFLAPNAPVRQPIRIGRKAGTGPHTITGTLVYFYCSDAEGWCMRASQPVALPVEIGK